MVIKVIFAGVIMDPKETGDKGKKKEGSPELTAVRGVYSDSPVHNTSTDAQQDIQKVQSVGRNFTSKLRNRQEKQAAPKPLALVVDDEPATRLILKTFLHHHFEVIQAKDGVEAFEKFKKEMAEGKEIALVITDRNMTKDPENNPGKNGEELIANLRAAGYTNGIIGISGADGNEISGENAKDIMIKAGANSFTNKKDGIKREDLNESLKELQGKGLLDKGMNFDAPPKKRTRSTATPPPNHQQKILHRRGADDLSPLPPL